MGLPLITRATDFAVGDEVQCAERPERYIVTYIDIKNQLFCGFGAGGASFIETMPTHYHKTGKTYPEIETLLAELTRENEEHA